MTKHKKQSNPPDFQCEAKYNGWENRETWAVQLWLDNDQSLYTTVQRLAHNAETEYLVADHIQKLIEDNNPLADNPSVYTDMLNIALSRVNWLEIARAFLEEE